MEDIANLMSPEPHPLRQEIRKKRIRLWQLRRLTAVSEAKLSRILNGIDELPPCLEKRLRQIIANISS
jgi:hypothetical protein